MKHHMRISKFLAIGAAIASLQASGPAQAAQAEIKQGSAVVKAIEGDAQYRVSGQDWKVLKVETVLKPGTEIKTGKSSAVDLFLNHNGPVVRVNRDSVLALRKLDRQEQGAEIITDTHLDVIAGSIMGYTQRPSPKSTYLVTTPVNEVTITGTHYQVTDEGYVILITGTAEVKWDRQQPFKQKQAKTNVMAGQTYDPELNGGTGGVRPTLPGDNMNVIADINTSKNNSMKFYAHGGKITVKPKKMKDVTKVKKTKKGKGSDDDDD